MNRTLHIQMARLLTGLLLLFCLMPRALLAEPRLYDVEVIIFSNPTGMADGELMDRPAPDAARASGIFPKGRFTELSPAFYGMDAIRSTLSAAPGYSVLFHRAWRQLANERADAVDYPVHSLAENGRDSVEGTITLIRERYLHLDMDLLLMTRESNTPVLYSDEPGSVPAFRLSERRRIRSSELHYFDHPRFGVIARVTPYQSPEEPAETEPVEETSAGDGQLPDEEAVPASEDEQSLIDEAAPATQESQLTP